MDKTIRRILNRGYAYFPDHDRSLPANEAIAALRAGLVTPVRAGDYYLELVMPVG